VHDSDGLLIVDGDKSSFWRPLTNPVERHRVSRFPVADLKGFGLMQRDRDFQNYQDLETRYDLHPSI
jgi:glucans biosynthesis protein